MSADVKTILIAGVPTQMMGEETDPYFQNLQENANGLQDLGAVVDRHVPEDSVVLDIGANIGLSSILLSRRARAVIAYEPSPVNLKHLRHNLTINGITNVTVNPTAVSAERGEIQFHEATFHAGSHVVTSDHVSFKSMSVINVPAIPLDLQDLPTISFIKLDVEGHEPNVLAGARALLSRDRPLIYCEINIWCLCAFAGHSPGALVRTLWNAFETWEVAKDGTLIPSPHAWTFLHELIVSRRGITDIVLRPRSNHAMPTLPELTWPLQALSDSHSASKTGTSELE